jgi:predicted nucleic acid-binding protein
MVAIRKQRLYLETTIFNYYFDTDRDGHEDTVKLFEAIGAGEYEGYTSEYAMIELRKALNPKQNNMLALIEKHGILILDIDAESERMTNLYIQNNIVPVKYRVDAAHIAIASIHDLDCVLSFNYKHINKLKTKRSTENVNLNEGYKGITICTPMEVLD